MRRWLVSDLWQPGIALVCVGIYMLRIGNARVIQEWESLLWLGIIPLVVVPLLGIAKRYWEVLQEEEAEAREHADYVLVNRTVGMRYGSSYGGVERNLQSHIFLGELVRNKKAVISREAFASEFAVRLMPHANEVSNPVEARLNLKTAQEWSDTFFQGLLDHAVVVPFTYKDRTTAYRLDRKRARRILRLGKQFGYVPVWA